MREDIKVNVNTITPLTNLLMTIGELPTSYLMSLTYEEQLLWFYNFLNNTIIPTINTSSEAVIELQNLFRLLQNYVNDYFDNLDVQEEIDNKLDKMAEDGSLQEIIADYLNSKAVFGYVNIDEMKEATNLILGSYARTTGFYELSDGGGALYKIVDEEVTADNMFYIELDNGLLAKLIVENELNIKTLGALGDGETNENTLFNTAVNSGYDLYIPKGTYLIENIKLKTRQKMRGENMTSTVIKCVDNNLENSVIVLGYENGVYNVITNLSIDGNKNNQTDEIDGLYLSNTSDSHHYIQMVQVYNCSGNGIYGYGQKELRIENSIIRGCMKHGIYLNSCSDNSLISTTVYSCLLNGFRLTAGMNRITDCKAFSNGRVTDTANDTNYTERYAGFYDTRGNTYTNCDAQGNYGHGFEFKNTNNLFCVGVRTNLNGIQVNNSNEIISFTEDPFYDGIHCDHCRYSTIITTALSMYTDDKKCQRYALCMTNDSGNSDYLIANISHTSQLSGGINEIPSSFIHYDIINNGNTYKALAVPYEINETGGFAVDNYLPLTIEKSSNLINIRGMVHNSSPLTDGTTYRILTIPSSSYYRTDKNIPINATIRSSQTGVPEALAYALINTNGQLQLKVPTITNGQYVEIDGVYSLD